MSLPHVQSDMKVSLRTGSHLACSAYIPVPGGSLLLVIEPRMPASASQVRDHKPVSCPVCVALGTPLRASSRLGEPTVH